MPLEPIERRLAFDFVIENWQGVIRRDRIEWFGRALESFRIHRCQFRNPLPDVGPLRIVSLGLGPRVLDPEVGGGIGPGSSRPLPATVVGGDLSIDKVPEEVSFPETPV